MTKNRPKITEKMFRAYSLVIAKHPFLTIPKIEFYTGLKFEEIVEIRLNYGEYKTKYGEEK